MSALLGAELGRLVSRRLFRWLIALGILGLVIAGVAVFVNSDPGSFRYTSMSENLPALSFPLIVLGWVVGASSIGAEWPHRTVSALLTWEPRRTRVLGAKLAAACLFAAAVAILLQVVFSAVMLPAASMGTFVGTDSQWWSEYLAVGGRITAVAVVAAAVGFGLATIGRNTGAALGGGLAYLLIVENLVRAFKPSWGDWLLGSNMARFIEGEAGFGLAARSTAESGLVLLLYAAGLFLLALLLFREREIA